MQGHIRTFIPRSGQIEVDDLYLGVDLNGKQYVIPVEAKSEREPLGVVQVVSLNTYALKAYPDLTLKSVAVKAWPDGSIFFLEFNSAVDGEDLSVTNYRRYRLIREGETQAMAGPDLEASNG